MARLVLLLSPGVIASCSLAFGQTDAENGV